MLNRSDIFRGCTDTMLLKMLSFGDSYGYKINKNISLLSGGELELKEATLYTSFRRLETDGYISSYWGDENTGARRRYYSITEKGRQLLEENINDWVETRRIADALFLSADIEEDNK